MTPRGLESSANLEEHPAVLAWRSFEGHVPPPSAITSLKQRHPKKTCKSRIYRLEGVGPGGSAIIAKECLETSGAVEQRIYERILPVLPVPAIRFHGVLPSREPGMIWMFLQDAGERAFAPENPAHRRTAARWAAAVHTAAEGLRQLDELPDRGPDHFRWHLRVGRDYIAKTMEAGVLDTADRDMLERLDDRLERLDGEWHRVEARCKDLPTTLVHCDLVPKNLRLTSHSRDAGPGLLVFDWEMSGRGIPASDLASLGFVESEGDLREYLEHVRGHWPGCEPATLRRMARLGRLFRLLASIHWIGTRLPYGGRSRPMATAHKYLNGFDDAVGSACEE